MNRHPERSEYDRSYAQNDSLAQDENLLSRA